MAGKSTLPILLGVGAVALLMSGKKKPKTKTGEDKAADSEQQAVRVSPDMVKRLHERMNRS